MDVVPVVPCAGGRGVFPWTGVALPDGVGIVAMIYTVVAEQSATGVAGSKNSCGCSVTPMPVNLYL